MEAATAANIRTVKENPLNEPTFLIARARDRKKSINTGPSLSKSPKVNKITARTPELIAIADVILLDINLFVFPQ